MSTVPKASSASLPPKFAVIIPVYNGRRYLVETLNSVLLQTYPAAEIIVVEDGSPVPSADLVAQFPSVTYIAQANTGVSGARNHGASVARAEWICFLDQDDVLASNHLEQFAQRLTSQPNADLLYTPRSLLVEQAGTWLQRSTAAPPMSEELPRVLLDRCPFPPSGVCIRRSLFSTLGGFQSRYDLAEDWEFWLRCLREGCTFHFCSQATVYYRVHPQSNSHRPLPILRANVRVIEECIVPSLVWPLSVYRKNRLISRQEADAAILLRQLGQEGALTLLLRSILRFPLGDLRRYKIALHILGTMLLPHLGKPSASSI